MHMQQDIVSVPEAVSNEDPVAAFLSLRARLLRGFRKDAYAACFGNQDIPVSVVLHGQQQQTSKAS
jgi:hypothetical protein